MWNRLSSKQCTARPRSQWWLMLVLAGSLLPALGVAQEPNEPLVTILKSGFHSIYPRHAFHLSLTEVGDPTSVSEVTIEFWDRANKRRAVATGTLSADRSFGLRVPIPAGAAVPDQLRVFVMIEPLRNGEGSQPIVGLEDLDPDLRQITTKPPCAPPSNGGGPEAGEPGGSGPQLSDTQVSGTQASSTADCDGWAVNRLTLEQAGRWPH
jgi:hypothetical protein